MFLRWIPQLLANVDNDKVFAVSHIVEKIALNYPQSMMYAYRLSKENYLQENAITETQTLIKRLDDLLLNDELVNLFLKALSSVTIPANVVEYHLKRFSDKFAKSQKEFNTFVDLIIKEIYSEKPDSGDVTSFYGNSFKSISGLKGQLELLKTRKTSACRQSSVKVLLEESKKLQRVPTNKLSVNLKDYCPWLANFHSADYNVSLEIPGQYTGVKKPLPQYHVRIAGFMPKVSLTLHFAFVFV